jgi:TonB family protein
MLRASKWLLIASFLTPVMFCQSPKSKAASTPSVVELSPAKSSKIPVNPAESPGGTAGTGGTLEILSDTMGVDFKPYVKVLRQKVQEHWDPLIPQSAMAPELKSGRVTVEFAVLRDGKIAGLKVTETSGDINLDRAAFGALLYSRSFAPLPEEFKGNYLLFRSHFLYNPNKEVKQQTSSDQTHNATPHSKSAPSPVVTPTPKPLPSPS